MQGARTQHGWLGPGFVGLGAVADQAVPGAVARRAGQQRGHLDADLGAQWLVVHDQHAAILVSLVQTADTLPAVLFALVGGVLADIFDRAKLLVAVLAGMTAAGAALTALTAVHRMPPALLLMFTFVLGTGAILIAPAYQSLVPDMVPREQLPAAAGLSSININLARAIGPAIAGLLVAQIGVAAVFALNTRRSCCTRSS